MNSWEGRLVFHIDADAFFASVEQVTNPGLKGKPVIVHGHPFHHGVVTAASYEARPYGVKAGMPNLQARQLLPGAEFVPVNIPKYLYFSLKLISVYLQYTPRVEAFSVDEVFMEMTGNCSEPAETAARLKAAVFEATGLRVSVGIGPNKLVAKIASDFQKPDGLTIVRPEAVNDFLGPLELQRCPGIGAKTFELLRQMGIITFAQLAAIPQAKLIWLFGKNGEKMYYAARGVDHSPVIPIDQLPPLKSKGHEITFDEPLASVERIKAIIRELSGKIGFALREKALLTTGVRLKIKPESGKAVTVQCRLGLETADERIIAKTAFELYLKHYAGKSLHGLGICAIGLLKKVDSAQLQLFEAHPNHPGNLQSILDQLKQKYGEGIIIPAVNLLNRKDLKFGEEPWAGF